MHAADAQIAVHQRIAACGLLPVVALPHPSLGVPLAEVLRDTGLPCIEITFRTDGAVDAIAAIRASAPEILVAAGTVTTVAQARDAIAAGAEVVLAPGTNPAVVETVLSAGIPMFPGVATPSEVEANRERGIRVMKLFPAEVLGGVRYLRALHAPYPDVRFIPTGGVSEQNLADYLAAPNVIACGGSWIASADVLAAGSWVSIADTVRRAVAIVERSRSVPETVA